MAGRALVIVPAFNESETLPGVLAELRLRGPDLDVLVVDDGSSDGTADVARAFGVPVLQMPFNLGIGGGLRAGFRYALERNYRRAFQVDGDGQHDPGQIGVLDEALDHGADLVVGSRFGVDDSTYAIGRVRSGAMRFLRLAMRLLAGRSFTDTSSGFRGFSRPMLEYFAQTYPVEYMDSVEALLLACYAGFTVVERPVTMRHRAGGVASNRRLRLIYNYLRLVVVMVTSASARRRAATKVAV